MLRIDTVEKAQELLELALEVQELERCSWKDALRRAINLLPQLAVDIMNDRRYLLPEDLPPFVALVKVPVHTCWMGPVPNVRVELPARKTVEAA